MVEDPSRVLPAAPSVVEVTAPTSGWLAATDAEELGRAAMVLGAGRRRKGDPVDHAVGIEFFPYVGDRLESGAPVARLHGRDEESIGQAGRQVLAALTIGPDRIEAPPLVLGWRGSQGGST